MFYGCKEQSAPKESVKDVEKGSQAGGTKSMTSQRQEKPLHVDRTERHPVQLKCSDQWRGPGESAEAEKSGRGQVTYRLVGWGYEFELGVKCENILTIFFFESNDIIRFICGQDNPNFLLCFH